MSWVSVELTAPAECAEAWSEALLEAGADSVATSDEDAGTEREAAFYGEPGTPIAPAWPANRIAALFETGADIATIIGACASRTGFAMPDYRVREVGDQDWVRLTQSQFKPIAIDGSAAGGKTLWIVPSWESCPDPQAISVTLDPGLAFGTGSHPTTRLCLRWLAEKLRGGETVLDYGCGSGILAIAALKLGARRAVGVDIDRQALAAAADNAARNGVAAEFVGADAPPDICADLVIANILANPLKLLAPILSGHCAPGGSLLLSGILEAQANEVIAAYRGLIELKVSAFEDGWVTLLGTRPRAGAC